MVKERSKKKEDVEQWLADKADQTHSEEINLDISIVVPAYNEERRLPPTLIDMIDYCESNFQRYEIIVVDDGSTDNTPRMVAKFQAIKPVVRFIKLPRNCGKGYAVKTGVLNARGALILFADADGATEMEELNRLIVALKSKSAGVAIGSRAIRSEDTRVRTRWYRKYLGRIFNLIVNTLVLPGFADTQCGFKLFTNKSAKFIFSHQESDGFSFDVEILLIALNAGLTIVEVPINWVNIPGSKVNLITDSLRMLRDVFIFKVKHRRITEDLYKTSADD